RLERREAVDQRAFRTALEERRGRELRLQIERAPTRLPLLPPLPLDVPTRDRERIAGTRCHGFGESSVEGASELGRVVVADSDLHRYDLRHPLAQESLRETDVPCFGVAARAVARSEEHERDGML